MNELLSAILLAVLGKEYSGQDCSLARSLEVIGERWTLLVIRDAFYGVRRFNDFQSHLEIPKAVLATRLSSLVKDGIMTRRPDPEHGGRHLYELSESGRALWPIVHGLLMWGGRYRAPNSRLFHHATCGTTLAENSSCPTCGLTPPPGDVVVQPRRGRGTQRDDPVSVALRKPHRLLEPLD
jgi:DNA-binding HxlR family transcriptional regulator